MPNSFKAASSNRKLIDREAMPWEYVTRTAERSSSKKDIKDLPFPIHSDPNAKLCAKPEDGHYMTEPMNAGEKFGGDYVGINYIMVQPAFEVVDKTGAVVQKWSWHSFQPPPSPMEWSTKVMVGGDSIILVLARPLSADILPAIKEGRDVRLASSIPGVPPKPTEPPKETSPAKAATAFCLTHFRCIWFLEKSSFFP